MDPIVGIRIEALQPTGVGAECRISALLPQRASPVALRQAHATLPCCKRRSETGFALSESPLVLQRQWLS